MQAQSILGKTTTYLALPAINASYPLFPLFVMLHSLTEGTTTQILANDSLRKIKQTTKLYKRHMFRKMSVDGCGKEDYQNPDWIPTKLF
jgi:hypothetical protein